MKKRCLRASNDNFALYGGRGITICDRWRNSFADFLADMGARPDGTTLDRINSDGNYEPSNCRRATVREQNRNTRAVKLSEALVLEVHGRCEHGESQSAVARRMGIDPSTVSHIRHGRLWGELR